MEIKNAYFHAVTGGCWLNKDNVLVQAGKGKSSEICTHTLYCNNNLDLIADAKRDDSPIFTFMEAIEKSRKAVKPQGSMDDFQVGPYFYRLYQPVVFLERDWFYLNTLLRNPLETLYSNKDHANVVIETKILPILKQRQGFKFRPRKSLKIYRFGNWKLLRGMETLNSICNGDFVAILDPTTMPSSLVFIRIQLFLPISFWDGMNQIKT